MSQADAEAIADWHYPDPYSVYDASADPGQLARLLDPEARGDRCVAVDDGGGELVGFFVFTPRGDDAIEIGLGLHPDWTGKGLGESFVEEGVAYARGRYEPNELVLEVAAFNRRAISVYERAGFTTVRSFTETMAGEDFDFVEMRYGVISRS